MVLKAAVRYNEKSATFMIFLLVIIRSPDLVEGPVLELRINFFWSSYGTRLVFQHPLSRAY